MQPTFSCLWFWCRVLWSYSWCIAIHIGKSTIFSPYRLWLLLSQFLSVSRYVSMCIIFSASLNDVLSHFGMYWYISSVSNFIFQVDKKTATTITWRLMEPTDDGGRPIVAFMVQYKLQEMGWESATMHSWTKGENLLSRAGHW